MTKSSQPTRRTFLERLAMATGAVVLMPTVTVCDAKKDGDGGGGTTQSKATSQATQAPPPADTAQAAAPDTSAPEPSKAPAKEGSGVPKAKPTDWNAVAFNKTRGNAGAIPESYRDDINGPDGDKKHLGKHLPYVPKTGDTKLPEGFVALMWGDPEKGHAKHPNAVRSDANNNEGHWYNWIKVRKAVDGDAEELQSTYADWPGNKPDDTGKYAVFGGGDITADGGRNTIYLAALPKDVKAGDTIRIWAHCLTHGEYVDFLTV